MHKARWYPTVLRMPNRDTWTMMGHYLDENNAVQANFKPTIWVDLVPGGVDFQATLDEFKMSIYYPFVFLQPDGRLFYTGRWDAGHGVEFLIDPVTLERTTVDRHTGGTGTNVQDVYPSACRIDGFLVKTGGCKDLGNGQFDPAVKTASYVNLLDLNPKWTKAANEMNIGRANHVLVGLPTGQVLAMGGCWKPNTAEDGDDPDAPEARLIPEIWSPLQPTQNWQKLLKAPLVTFEENGQSVDAYIRRAYHSVAFLLPNAKVFHGGGDPPDTSKFRRQQKAQIFSPPYGGRNDWETVRPTQLTLSAQEIANGQTFTATIKLNSSSITASRVTLVGFPSVTHAFDQGGFVRSMAFTQSAPDGNNVRTLTVTAPTENGAMPGFYMLFVVDSQGIPSTAKIVRVRGFDPIFAESLLLYSYADAGEAGITSANSLYLADNARFGPFRSGTSPTGTQMVAEGTAPSYTPSTFQAVVETKVDKINGASGDDVRVTIEGYNWTTSSYETFGSAYVERGDPTSSSKEVRYTAYSSGTPASHFVQATTRKTKIRVTWLDEPPNSSLFDFRVDMVRMGVRP